MDHFLVMLPLNDRKRAAFYSKIGRPRLLCNLFLTLFLLFCSLTLCTFQILLLMSGNVYPNPRPAPTYPCLICSKNVTWRGKSVQCTICLQLVHFCCTTVSATQFNSIGSSYFWSCPTYSSTRYTSPVIPRPADSTSNIVITPLIPWIWNPFDLNSLVLQRCPPHQTGWVLHPLILS